LTLKSDRHAAKRENGYILAESAGRRCDGTFAESSAADDMIACQCVAANRRDRGWCRIEVAVSAQRRDDDFIRVVARGGLIAFVLGAVAGSSRAVPAAER
jgi:hypothetical protein